MRASEGQVESLLKDAKIISEIDVEQARAYLTVDELIKKQQEQDRLLQLQASEGQGQLSLQPEGVENVLRECSADEPTFYTLTPLQNPNYTPQENPEYAPLTTHPVPQLGEQFFPQQFNGQQEPVNFVQNNSSDDQFLHFEEIHDFQCADAEQSVQPAVGAPNVVNVVANQSGELMYHQQTVLPSVNETFQFAHIENKLCGAPAKQATRGRKKRQSPVEVQQVVESFRMEECAESPGKKKPKISMEELRQQIRIMENDPNHDQAELRKLKNNEACRNHRGKRKHEEVKKDAELEAAKRDNECLKGEVQKKEETIQRLKGVLRDVHGGCPNIPSNLKQRISTALVA